MQNSIENINKNNLFTELLVSNKNNSLLETIQIQTLDPNPNPNTTNEEIFKKYNKLKKKINLFWNKVE